MKQILKSALLVALLGTSAIAMAQTSMSSSSAGMMKKSGEAVSSTASKVGSAVSSTASEASSAVSSAGKTVKRKATAVQKRHPGKMSSSAASSEAHGSPTN